MRKLTQTLALLVLTLSLLLGGCAQPAPGPSGSPSGISGSAGADSCVSCAGSALPRTS